MESPRNSVTNILIVEDDRAAIEILCFIIAKKFSPGSVYLAYDGEMGVQVFKEHLPNIVITDINMPKMDGIAMAEEIRSISPGTKIIILTAYSDRIRLDKFREIGISHHILKPVQFETLFTAIEAVSKEIQLERQ